MTMKAKIILYADDGVTEHAQGIVNADKYTGLKLVERNKHVYAYDTFRFEDGMLVMLFTETNIPAYISEF